MLRKFTLFLGDIAILYGALYGTLLLRYGGDFQSHMDQHIIPFTLIFIVWLIAFYITDLYEISIAKNSLQFFTRLFYTIIVNAVIALSFFYLIPYFEIAPKRNLFIFLALALALFIAWRWLFNRLLIKNGIMNNTLIIGACPQSYEIYEFLLKHPQLGYNALGILDVQEKTAVEILEKLVRQKKARVLVLSPDAYKIPDIIQILYSLLSLRIEFYSLSGFYEQVTGKVPLEVIDQGWFINNLSEGRKRVYETASRATDILGAIIMGLVSLIFYPFIMIAIKASSRGPIFYSHKRIGQAGKIFTLTKFRSMIANAEINTGAVWTQENDPRITKVGSFLRKTRLDELPQLWNILKGDMSFVGPRSERPEFHEKLKREIPFYEERYLIKPGLTGWSQLKFGYGASVEDAKGKLQYDLYYIKNRSLLFDLGIVLKTVNIVLEQAGR
ncbi:MAG: sugar transferase [Parcubacteria group bacterium]